MTVRFEHGCALHYTFTCLACKRHGMDKSILAHQFVHFSRGKQLERRDVLLQVVTDPPGLTGLVDLAFAVRGSA